MSVARNVIDFPGPVATPDYSQLDAPQLRRLLTERDRSAEELRRSLGKALAERDEAREYATQLSALMTEAGLSPGVRSKMFGYIKALKRAAEAGTDEDGYLMPNPFDILDGAGIPMPVKDDSEEERQRAVQNGLKAANRVQHLAEGMGLIEIGPKMLKHDDPDDPQRITGAVTRVKPLVPLSEAMREVVKRAPKPTKKAARGPQAEPVVCPKCGRKDCIEIQCGGCGWAATGEEYVQQRTAVLNGVEPVGQQMSAYIRDSTVVMETTPDTEAVADRFCPQGWWAEEPEQLSAFDLAPEDRYDPDDYANRGGARAGS
jgi:hypothetical protein